MSRLSVISYKREISLKKLEKEMYRVLDKLYWNGIRIIAPLPNHCNLYHVSTIKMN